VVFPNHRIFSSPRFELPAAPENVTKDVVPNKPKSVIVCHFCGEPGHKAMFCTKATGEHEVQRIRPHQQEQQHQPFEHHQPHMSFRDRVCLLTILKGGKVNERGIFLRSRSCPIKFLRSPLALTLKK